MNRISDSMFHSRSAACKKPYGAVPAGQAVEFSVYPQRAQGALHVTLWIEEDGCETIMKKLFITTAMASMLCMGFVSCADELNIKSIDPQSMLPIFPC